MKYTKREPFNNIDQLKYWSLVLSAPICAIVVIGITYLIVFVNWLLG